MADPSDRRSTVPLHRDKASRLQQALDSVVAAGATAALVGFRDGDTTWFGSSGVAEVGSRRPVAADGFFRIGSVTKTFTATVILQLVGEGRLALGDTVERWLPGLVPGGDQITLRQLLDFTSGLYNYTDDLDVASILAGRSRQWSPVEVVTLATNRPPRFRPGTSRAYCNTSYLLLGLVIEEATGAAYEAEVSRRILRPLGMRQTVMPDAAEVLPEPHVHAYLMVDDRRIDITTINASHAGAAGGMVSTAADLNHFFRALLTGGLLGTAELQLMQAIVPTGVPGLGGGLGVARVTLPGGLSIWGKDGGAYGFQALSFHTADGVRQLTMSITTGVDARLATVELLTGIAEVFLPTYGE